MLFVKVMQMYTCLLI